MIQSRYHPTPYVSFFSGTVDQGVAARVPPPCLPKAQIKNLEYDQHLIGGGAASCDQASTNTVYLPNHSTLNKELNLKNL